MLMSVNFHTVILFNNNLNLNKITRFPLFNVVPRKHAHLFVASHYNIPICLDRKRNSFLPRKIREFEMVQNHGNVAVSAPYNALHQPMSLWYVLLTAIS